jgi:23S rRNA (cytosine1962-C5)-methyltransferase
MVVITLKPKEDIRIRQGHPWIYENEIAVVEGIPAPGEEVEVHDARGLPIGDTPCSTHIQKLELGYIPKP